MDNTDVIGQFSRNIGNFFNESDLQRTEIFRSFEFRDGHQWTGRELQVRTKADKKTFTVNLSAPFIYTIAGIHCMSDMATEIISMDEEYDPQASAMQRAAMYVRGVSGFDIEQSKAYGDALACGIGGVVTWLDTSHKEKISGLPVVDRIFPGFLFFDKSIRSGKVNRKSSWCGYADPVSRETLQERISEYPKAETGASDPKGFLTSFLNGESVNDVEFIYHYFYRKREPIIDVLNPFTGADDVLTKAVLEDEDVANIIGSFAKKVNLNLQATYWSLNPEEYKDLRKSLKLIEALRPSDYDPLQTSTRKGYCYYHAEFAGGYLLYNKKTYTQDGFPLNIITGRFDETRGVYYGILRPLSEVQHALNMSFSDLVSYVSTVSNGGSAYISFPDGGGEALERIIKEKRNENAITPLPDGASVTPKALPNTPQVLIEAVRLMVDILPKLAGVTPELMGAVSSGDMTGALFGQIIRQSSYALEEFRNNGADSAIRQSEIEIAIAKMIASTNDSLVLPILYGDNTEQRFRLMQQDLGREYAVRRIERPMTEDEKQDAFNKIIELIPILRDSGIDVSGICKMIIKKYAPLSYQDRQKIEEILTPQPAQPDPLNQSLLEAQVRLTNAQALELESQAQKQTNESAVTQAMDESQIELNLAKVNKTKAETADILTTKRED